MMKSYTDIEQSKKLAEILPLESADMYYPNRIDLKYQGALPIEFKRGNPLLSQEIPAWSLAALLSTLPDIHLKKYTYDGITKYYATLIGIRQFNSKHYDNPVDTCYEMIIHLHELNLL